MLTITLICFFDYIAVQAFPVFTFDGFLGHSETPSFASLVSDVQLPEDFIVCSSSKLATFHEIGFYSIMGDDSRDWLTLSIRPFWPVVQVTIYWDRQFHSAGDLEDPKLDHWYHICLKFDLSKTEIEFAINGGCWQEHHQCTKKTQNEHWSRPRQQTIPWVSSKHSGVQRGRHY